jgi:single-stranded-DNA-specific exonuclease
MAIARKTRGVSAAAVAGASTDEAFLGVVRSARGLVWRERLAGADINRALMISQRHSLPELLGRVIAARGIGADETPVFLDPTLKALMPDPSTLQGMDATAARLADAIMRREPVAVFGDYDVDGACSSALMARFFAAHNLDCRIYIPDRLFEGYGPNPQAIELLAKDGAKLIVTVDCGTTSFEPLAVAKKVGVDVLVIDHHQADATLPDVVAVVNPNRQDDLSGLGHLCAAGVVFLVLVATARELKRRKHYDGGRTAPDLLQLLDLVALATVCDVVPLKSLNRAYVVKGLQVMKSRENVGLRALFDAAGLDAAPSTYHLGYILGPRINAGGRIGDAGLGSKLLSINDPMEAAKIAETLNRLNHERKAMETQMLEEAMGEADRLVDETPDMPLILVGSESWHKGVVGLVASRLTERFHRPSCVIAWASDSGAKMTEGTGSLRSVGGVDIGGAVRAAVGKGLLKKGGGHAMAAGLTVARDGVEALKAFLCDALKDSSKHARATAGLDIDGAVTPSAITAEFMTLIERAGPYGQGNAQPRFVFPAHRVKFAKVVGDAHVRCSLQAGDGKRIDGIAFRAAGQPLGELLLGANGGMAIHVAGTLKRDTWGGREKIDLMIDDAADPRQQS